MSLMDRIMNFFGMNEEEEEYEELTDSDSMIPHAKGKSNIVSLHTQKSIRLVLLEPRSYEDTQEIADNLKSHRPVVVNLQRVRRDLGLRIIDFLSGTVYALGGNIQKLGSDIFICAPANVDIQGTITEILKEDRMKD